eukprot:GHVS01027628.1.p1 GENE.GHVS01027628.1~~GHVS01027628.1.p1  ORF type:complete len:202 (+),score=2.48 GHVS01027628.1:248-853(+)
MGYSPRRPKDSTHTNGPFIRMGRTSFRFEECGGRMPKDSGLRFLEAFLKVFQGLSNSGLCFSAGVKADPKKVEALTKPMEPVEPCPSRSPLDGPNEERGWRMVKSGRSFILETDASEMGAGASSHRHQVLFASTRLSPTQSRWSTYGREAYALKWAVEHFSHYLRGAQVEVRTDHASLQWMASADDPAHQRCLEQSGGPRD